MDPRINLFSSHGPQASPWPSGFVRPGLSLRCEGRTMQTVARSGDTVFRRWDDPLEALEWMAGQFGEEGGRWIGHLNYDLGRLFEVIPTAAHDDLNVPLFQFTWCVPTPDRPPHPEPHYATRDLPLVSNFTRAQYEQSVQRALDYIAAGDVFQINLSQRFTAGLPEQPPVIYRRLVRDTPPAYGALLSYGDYAVISNSPELFLHVQPLPDGRRRIVTRPIKGTRPRLPGMDEQLRHSLKDQAELNMIVDLERNDLGRICEIASVRVTEARAIEAYPTVYHGVATIEGMLRSNVSFVDLLRAVFPGGSITGAPKIRAMQIIEELEPTCRGPYCGAIGYLAADGSMMFNIAIRTMTVTDGLVHVPVGGGVVADSTPEGEYEETLVKAEAMFAALGMAPPASSQHPHPMRRV